MKNEFYYLIYGEDNHPFVDLFGTSNQAKKFAKETGIVFFEVITEQEFRDMKITEFEPGLNTK
jgi:hypothetical protein